jgi:phosphatidylserine decarboxylase
MVRDGWVMVIPLIGVTILCLILAQWAPNPVWIPLASVSGVLGLMIGFFFRDPSRMPPDGEGLVLSAADGKVVAIQEIDHEQFVDGQAIQVSVFLSILNVHVNRMPLSGTVQLRKSTRGKYLLANKDAASLDNEQMMLGIESEWGKIVVKQIVGFIARRIVCHVHEGEMVHAGQKFGLIRFGSRVDVIVPYHAKIMVKIGDRVKGGVTILGVMK